MRSWRPLTGVRPLVFALLFHLVLLGLGRHDPLRADCIPSKTATLDWSADSAQKGRAVAKRGRLANAVSAEPGRASRCGGGYRRPPHRITTPQGASQAIARQGPRGQQAEQQRGHSLGAALAAPHQERARSVTARAMVASRGLNAPNGVTAPTFGALSASAKWDGASRDVARGPVAVGRLHGAGGAQAVP
jgi:hypothetical protein